MQAIYIDLQKVDAPPVPSHLPFLTRATCESPLASAQKVVLIRAANDRDPTQKSSRLACGKAGGLFNLNSVGASYNFTNLFNWNIENTGWFSQFNTGVGGYSISAILHFSDPSDATGTGSGYAGFVTLLGTVSAGFIDWTAATGTVDFGAIELDFVLHDAANIGFGTGASSGATFTLAAVPVPAGGLLLIGALGGLAALRRRKAA
jgi:hypothetical protein